MHPAGIMISLECNIQSDWDCCTVQEDRTQFLDADLPDQKLEADPPHNRVNRVQRTVGDVEAGEPLTAQK